MGTIIRRGFLRWHPPVCLNVLRSAVPANSEIFVSSDHPAFHRLSAWHTILGRLCLLGLTFSTSAWAAPAIWFTQLPAYDSTEGLAGKATGVDTAKFGVAVLIYVPGYGWVSKPNCAAPLTPLAPDGTWQTDVTTGGSDAQATRMAALLVETNKSLPCVQGQAHLSTLYSNAAAIAISTRPRPGVRWVRFSGYDWWVKRSSGKAGPGPNYFSDSARNVWVDDDGRLHLRITLTSNQWHCAEIVSARSFGRGSYRFQIDSDVNALDANAVLGLFTWSDDPAYAHREIDFEAARWGNSADVRNSQYVVQPYDLPGRLQRLTIPAGTTNVTHVFNWQTNRVVFASMRGAYQPAPGASNTIAGWTYTQTVPEPGDENVRLNLWLNAGNAPARGQEIEIVVSSFVFSPSTAPGPARLGALDLESQSAELELTTEPGRRYTIQSSTNLVDWAFETTLLAESDQVAVEVSAPASPRFYRSLTLP